MPVKGVSTKEQKIIDLIIEPYKSKYVFYCYGSRVKGNFRPLSDLDILVIPQDEISMPDMDELREKFDESLLPYVVNLAYNLDEKFYKLIEKDLIKI